MVLKYLGKNKWGVAGFIIGLLGILLAIPVLPAIHKANIAINRTNEVLEVVEQPIEKGADKANQFFDNIDSESIANTATEETESLVVETKEAGSAVLNKVKRWANK